MTHRVLAIIGARGIGHHGGFETVVKELAPRLYHRGFEVYCSTRGREAAAERDGAKNIRLMEFPLAFPKSYRIGKMFEVLYDAYFVLKSRYSVKCDVVYCLGIGAGLALMLTKFSRGRAAVNVDGLEWRRDKFGALTRFFLKLSFIACCIGSDKLVLDNRELLRYVPRRFRGKAIHISYGAPFIGPDRMRVSSTNNVLDGLGLTQDGYWLVVARLEPENSIHTIIQGYRLSRSHRPLVIVGGHSSDSYRNVLERLVSSAEDSKRVIMTGPIYEPDDLTTLRLGCFAYIHGHTVGGTNPSLLEAMSASNAVICHDNVFNRDVCSDAGKYFRDAAKLASVIDEIETSPGLMTPMRERARLRSEKYHCWDDIADEHERLFDVMTQD